MGTINEASSTEYLAALERYQKERNDLIAAIANRLGLNPAVVAAQLQQANGAPEALLKTLAPQDRPDHDWLTQAVAAIVRLDEKVSKTTQANTEAQREQALAANAATSSVLSSATTASFSASDILVGALQQMQDTLTTLQDFRQFLVSRGFAVQSAQTIGNTQATLLKDSNGNQVGIITSAATEAAPTPRPTLILVNDQKTMMAYVPEKSKSFTLNQGLDTDYRASVFAAILAKIGLAPSILDAFTNSALPVFQTMRRSMQDLEVQSSRDFLNR